MDDIDILSHVVSPLDTQVRLNDYAIGIFPQIPTKSAVKKTIKKGLILVNGEPGFTGTWIKESDCISLLPGKNKNKIYALDIKIIYEDDHLAVVEKPTGLVTSGNKHRTLENTLPYNLLPSNMKDGLEWMQPIHRLDSMTAGMVIVAKTFTSRQLLYEAFQQNKISKKYVVVVHGLIDKEKKISTPIEGKMAKTIITPIKNLNQNKSLLMVEIITGRTHQIRIHLSSIGHPVVGDTIYDKEKGHQHRGLYLYAYSLSFIHPQTQELLTFELDFPKRISKLL